MSDFKDRRKFNLLSTATNRYINIYVHSAPVGTNTNEIFEGWMSSVAFSFADNVSGIIGLMIYRDGVWAQLATNTLATQSDTILVDNIYVKDGDRIQIDFAAAIDEDVNIWITSTYEPVGTGPTWTSFAYGLIEQSSSSSSSSDGYSSSSSSSQQYSSSSSSSSSQQYSSSSSSSVLYSSSSSSSSNLYSSSSSSSSNLYSSSSSSN